jgi:hypothetical protein
MPEVEGVGEVAGGDCSCESPGERYPVVGFINGEKTSIGPARRHCQHKEHNRRHHSTQDLTKTCHKPSLSKDRRHDTLEAQKQSRTTTG